MADDGRLMNKNQRKVVIEWSQIASNLAVVASVIVAIFAYVWQRQDAAELQRQQLAAEMVQRKYDGALFAAYQQVSEAYDSRNDLLEIASGVDPKDKQRLSDDLIGAANLANLRIVVDYYEDLLACADSDSDAGVSLCDKSTVERLAGRDMRNFACKARLIGFPELRERYSYQGYGRRLEAYAGDCLPPKEAVKN